ncbi:MAG: ABC transporter ATP-binding protein [Dehalococcoidia bacterium]|nr:ABC transporter ATP-binding protein [Dehalococcoidia bacterium]
MKTSIELDGVSFSYGEKNVLNEVAASVAAGEFVCLLGPNGAGKTTLAQLVAGELSPTEGRVFLASEDASGKPTGARRHIAYLPQDLQDPPFVNARELVSLGRFNPKRSLGWRMSDEDKEAVQDCIARCLAESFADRPFAQLSGGEKQRIWLAFCLAQQREFLLLDESLHKIDYSTRELFFKMLSNLAEDGKGVILITHDLQMAERHGRRLLLLKSGGLVYDGPPDKAIYSLMERQ